MTYYEDDYEDKQEEQEDKAEYVYLNDDIPWGGVEITPEIDARIREALADEVAYYDDDVESLASELFDAGAIGMEVDWSSAYAAADEDGQELILCSLSELSTELTIRNVRGGVDEVDPEDERYYPDVSFQINEDRWASGVAEVKQARERERLAWEAAVAERSTPEYRAAEAAREAAEAAKAAEAAQRAAERIAAAQEARAAQEREAAAEAARAAAWEQQLKILTEVGISAEYVWECGGERAGSARAIIVRAAGGGHMSDEAEITAHAVEWARQVATGDAPRNFGGQRMRAMAWLAEHPDEEVSGEAAQPTRRAPAEMQPMPPEADQMQM